MFRVFPPRKPVSSVTIQLWPVSSCGSCTDGAPKKRSRPSSAQLHTRPSFPRNFWMTLEDPTQIRTATGEKEMEMEIAEICRVCFKLHCRRVGRSWSLKPSGFWGGVSSKIQDQWISTYRFIHPSHAWRHSSHAPRAESFSVACQSSPQLGDWLAATMDVDFHGFPAVQWHHARKKVPPKRTRTFK